MFKTKKIFILLLFSFLFNSIVIAQDKIVFIDLEQIVNNTNIGKKTLSELNKINLDNIEKLKIKENLIKEKEISLNNTKNIISKTELQNKINLLKNEISIYNKEKNEKTNDFIKLKNKKLDELFKQINPLVSEYMNKNSITLIVDKKNVYLGKMDYDITDDIVELVNTKLK
jgi:outer membrane protein|tara:strand:+ start:1359 stop:1871 length:513 start_codon:yes stop_codon:yes gene_type:complete